MSLIIEVFKLFVTFWQIVRLAEIRVFNFTSFLRKNLALVKGFLLILTISFKIMIISFLTSFVNKNKIEKEY